jgi:hypothetical protein
MMTRILIFALAVLFFGCAHEKENISAESGPFVPPASASTQQVRPVDYQGRSEGRALPPWLRTYLSGGKAALEADRYALSYIFVTENRNSRLSVINQWLRNFRTDYDVSRLIAARIRTRLDMGQGQSLKAMPDKVYGRNYQAAVKAAYSTVYWGAEREENCWILDADGTYRGYILILIPQDTLEIQIKALLGSIKTTSTHDQDQEFKAVVDHFFENF